MVECVSVGFFGELQLVFFDLKRLSLSWSSVWESLELMEVGSSFSAVSCLVLGL